MNNKKKQSILNSSSKRRKLKEIHKEYINSLVQSNITQQLRASSINKRLMNEFPEMDKVSN